MDPGLFNHRDKCRLCFASPTHARGEFFKITQEVSKRFFRLTQVELKPCRRFSRSICESCCKSLTSFADFQCKLVRNQQRLLEFDVKANPFVALQRLDDEPTLAFNGSAESHLVDPFFPVVDIKVEVDEKNVIKTELEEATGENLPETWLFNSYLLDEKKEIEEPQKTETRKRRCVLPIVEPKKRKLKSSPKEPKSVPVNTQRVLARKLYMEKVLKPCTSSDCDLMIHPNLQVNHNEIFHPTRVKGEPKPKVPERVAPPRQLCPYCGNVFKSASYRKHLFKHFDEADGITLQCDLCNFTTFKMRCMYQHMLHHHILKRSERHPCPQCSKTFRTKQSSQIHVKNVHLKVPKVYDMHRCEICNFDFKSRVAFEKHNARLHEEGNFKCTRCSEVFKFKPRLEDHMLTVHAPKVTCHICGELVSPGIYLTQHMKKHKMKICPYEGCGKEVKVAYYRNHVEKNHEPLNLQCPHCPAAVFKTSDGYKEHYRTQHEEKYEAVVCKVTGCGYEVKRKQYLDEHYMRHKGITDEEREYLLQHSKRILRPNYNASPLGREISIKLI